MNKNVLISITGIQTEHENIEEENCQNEPIEIINPATYFFQNGSHYIFFEEVFESTRNVTKNKIIFKEKETLEVIKKEAVNSTMFFSCEEPYETIYETPYGEMHMEIITYNIDSIIEESEINIQVKYALNVNGEAYADCEITLRIYDPKQGI